MVWTRNTGGVVMTDDSPVKVVKIKAGGATAWKGTRGTPLSM
jgi:hypothetical protein